MMESVDRAYRIKCNINLIGGSRSEIGPLARVMGSTFYWHENDNIIMQIDLPNGQEGV